MRKIILYLFTGVFALFYACEPRGPETIGQLDAVITNYDPQFDFASANTYILIDSVIHVQDPENPNSNVQLPRTIDGFVLNQVVSNLDNLGYTRLTNPEDGQIPDLVVQISALATTNTVAYSNYYGNPWWDYWGWYPGWNAYFPYMGRGWYPYSSITLASYATGSVNIEMFNLNAPDTVNQQIPRVWVASLRGILEQNPANLEARIGPGITRAFQQSPYLVSNE